MSAYYNEFDPFAAAWLRELIKDGLIADGVVDERSIEDVEPNDLKGFTQCHFFAGIGGWSAAARLARWSDDRSMWTGSPPCQPFSTAGKNKGKDDLRHLWPVFFNLIRECKPSVVFGEQVASAIRHGWFCDLQTDLEAQGYAAALVVLPSASVGAPHKRDRLFYIASSVADSRREGSQRFMLPRIKQIQKGRQGEKRHIAENNLANPWRGSGSVMARDGKRRPTPTESSLQPMASRLPNRVGILRGAGNAIVPQVAAEIIKAYMDK